MSVSEIGPIDFTIKCDGCGTTEQLWPYNGAFGQVILCSSCYKDADERDTLAPAPYFPVIDVEIDEGDDEDS